eukprot:scaffold9360_cov37-Phaeocystis_antarctica.AAC.1
MISKEVCATRRKGGERTDRKRAGAWAGARGAAGAVCPCRGLCDVPARSGAAAEAEAAPTGGMRAVRGAHWVDESE